MSNSDYYSILGVSKNASKEDIQKAYRKLARKYHPDVNKDAGAEDMFKKVNEARGVLTDPETRKLYDRYGSKWKEAQTQGEQQQQWSSDNSRWGDFSGGFGHREGSSHFEQEDFGDFFSDIFGGGGRQEKQWGGFRQSAGRTVEADLEVSLDELVNGASKTISWSSMERTGRSLQPKEEKIQLKIPKGLKDGSVIRLAGKGEEGRAGGPAGDLLLRVHVRPNSTFSLKGYDLLTTVPVSPWEAALGAKVAVETLHGKINLTVPKGCPTGKKMRVKGKGLPKKNGEAGDLYVQVEIHVPKNLSDEEKELFRQLRKKSSYNPRSSLGQWAVEMAEAA